MLSSRVEGVSGVNPLSKLDEEIKARTERFAEDLAELVKRAALESISNALSGADEGRSSAGRRAASAGGRRAAASGRASVGRRGASSASGGVSRGRKKGQKRSAEDLESLTEALYGEIKREAGRGIEAISAAMGVSSKELTLPVRKLLGQKRLKTKGEKRATKYYAK
jgi:hypothetical protein